VHNNRQAFVLTVSQSATLTDFVFSADRKFDPELTWMLTDEDKWRIRLSTGILQQQSASTFSCHVGCEPRK